MVETYSPTVRGDAEIAADIDAIIQQYPPLVHDRNHLRVSVLGGVATVSGHLRSLNTRDYFLQALAAVDDLQVVNTDYLHVDEIIRLSMGRVLPLGVIANVEYGTVVLSGQLPPDQSVDDIVTKIGGVPGVRRVVVAFRD